MVFSEDEAYLVFARFTDEEGPTSDYTRDKIYYRSLQHSSGIRRDRLTIRDYIWRWDTDWFWCSRAFGAQNPKVRRVWPRKYRRSDFYHRIVGWENRWGFAAKIDDRVATTAGDLAESFGPEIASVISDTIERWDADEASRRIELHVGRDLQFIRINGTVVGSLAGLIIYSIAQLLF